MAVDAIRIGEVFDYTLPDDKENPTIWKLTALGSIVKSRIMNKTMEIESDPDNPEEIKIVPKFDEENLGVDIQMTKFGLKGFSNFKESGKDVEFKTEDVPLGGKTYKVISEETLEYIPREIIAILSGEILKASEVSKGEEKNS